MKRDIYHDDLRYWADQLLKLREKYHDVTLAVYRPDYITDGEDLKKAFTIDEIIQLRNVLSEYSALSVHMSEAVQDDEKWKNRFKFWKK